MDTLVVLIKKYSYAEFVEVSQTTTTYRMNNTPWILSSLGSIAINNVIQEKQNTSALSKQLLLFFFLNILKKQENSQIYEKMRLSNY